MSPRYALIALSMAAFASAPGPMAQPMAHGASAGSCIAPISYLPLEPALVGADSDGLAALGTYERISPDGRFVLRSYSGALVGKVTLMELPASGALPIHVYRTPFSNEAFPVQGTWRYLVDVNGDHYRFADVLARQGQARPVFSGGMTGFYAAASEMQGATAANALADFKGPKAYGDVFIRSLSWPQGSNPDDAGVGPMQVAVLRIRETEGQARVVQTIGPNFVCGQRRQHDGGVFALPMISIDGTEFSAIPQAPTSGAPSMRVYGLSPSPDETSHPCDLRADLGFSPGKAVFGFPGRDASPAVLTYSDLGDVYIFDRVARRSFRLDHGQHRVLASAFPGLTRDGRVIYGATWQVCPQPSCAKQSGYVVVDPYQSRDYRAHWSGRSGAAPKACITADEVRQERSAFARFHGIQH